MSRPPIIEPAARALFEAGRALSNHTLAAHLGCHPRAARRVLQRLHAAREIYIAEWERGPTSPHPVFRAGRERDARKPRPKTRAELSRAFRQRHPERYAMRRPGRRLRVARAIVAALPEPFRALTFFGKHNSNENGERAHGR